MSARVIIANPGAGKYGADGTTLSARLSQRPDEYIVLEMTRPDLVEEVEKLIAQKNVETLVAMGGDGTVMFVLTLILKHGWPVNLGIIPVGTGNLLAAALGIPRDIQSAITVLEAGHAMPLCVGRANDRYFTLNAGVGIDADVIAETPDIQKKALGLTAYFLHGCRSMFRPEQRSFTIVADGKTRRVRARGVMVIIQRNFLSRFDPFYKPRPEDGMTGRFDVCVFKIKSPGDCIHALVELFTKKYTDPAYQSPVIEHFEATHVSLESKPRVDVQADGDLIGRTPVTFEYFQDAVEVIVPRQNAL